MNKIDLRHGDCREIIKTLADCSIDSVVTDPPYSLVSIQKRFGKAGSAPAKSSTGWYKRASSGFMGQAWDTGDTVHDPAFWAEVLRVLKPGAHLLAFAGTRTYHRMACAIEDAGFEIRDQVGWLFGAGFPKSHDVAKGIDKMLGANGERVPTGDEVRRIRPGADQHKDGSWEKLTDRTYQPHEYEPGADAARQWQGWGTALKPAFEPLVLAQKPYTPQQFLAILVPTVGELICRVASCEKTDTPLFGSLRAHGFLSTATSLNNYLVALSGRESKCTTETAIALTTDLRILKSSLSGIMRAITTAGTSLTNGAECDALLAATISRSVLAKCERLASTTAGEIAIDWHADEGSGPAGAEIRPLWEPICLARKPLIGTVAANVMEHGTGALNIDGCRVRAVCQECGGHGRNPVAPQARCRKCGGDGRVDIEENLNGGTYAAETETSGVSGSMAGPLHNAIGKEFKQPPGRWPASVFHDGSDEVGRTFPDSDGQQRPVGPANGAKTSVNTYGDYGPRDQFNPRGDGGSAARFFYSAKADAEDRLGSKHPTVKPVDLIAYLARLVTPPGGLILDPFAGTGTLGAACMREGFRCILIEREAQYVADIKKRLDQATGANTPLFSGVPE